MDVFKGEGWTDGPDRRGYSFTNDDALADEASAQAFREQFAIETEVLEALDHTAVRQEPTRQAEVV